MQTGLQLIPLIDTSSAYDHLVDQLRRHPPDVIYLALDNAMLFEFVGKLRKRGILAQLVGGQRLNSQTLLGAARKFDAPIQIISPIGATNSPQFKKVSDLLTEADVIPDLVALNTYAAVQTWSQAVQRAGVADPDQVTTIIRSQEFQTIIGRVAFDQRGARRDVDFSIWTLREGRLDPAIEPRQ
jgi:branched-chain amino acid transport system substrate-binding protein